MSERKTGIAASLGAVQHLRVVPNPANGQTANHSDGQQPDRLNSEAPARRNSQNAGRLDGQTARRSGLPLQGVAKSKHPDYCNQTVYVRKQTMRDAMRLYEDGGGTEKSVLVQELLEHYIARGGRHG